jgi:RND family efflux transporter MFP subunit
METTEIPPPRRRTARPEPDHMENQPATQHSPPPAHDEWGEIHKPGRGKIMVTAVVAVVLVTALFLTGFIPRVHQNSQLNADAAAERDAAIPVNVVTAVRAKDVVSFSVSGTLRPWQETSVYARTTGYLGKWSVDINDSVKQGDVMATIDSPEVDEQLSQAQAALSQMKAATLKAQSDLQIAEVTYNRYQALKGTSGVTQQDLDQKTADMNAAQAALASANANVQAAEANVKRLSDLQSYEQVIAPFPGIVTGRTYDIGALILADPTQTDTQPMYKIAENDVLRVFVNVPQSSALSIVKHMKANVTTRERPGRVFVGEVMGTTNYLDTASRSLLTEVKVPNADGALLPGMYVNVDFQVIRPTPPMLVPGPALIDNADGEHVAIVQDGKVHYQPVTVGIDYGATVEITGGLTGDEQIISNPGERTIEGAKVRAITAEGAK